MPVSIDQWMVKVEDFSHQVVSNVLLCTYDIGSAYRKLISVMCSLSPARVIVFFQTIINLSLLRSYYKFHPFRVCNALVSSLYLSIWYDFAAGSMPLLILLSSYSDIFRQSFSICHRNLNSISVHNLTKVSVLATYVLVDTFDILCLSETYLNSETSTDYKNLEIAACYLLRADHPFNDPFY